MNLDRKFSGVIIKNKDASVVPIDQYIVFLAKDDALPATLEFYEQECRRIGCNESQIAGVRALRDRLMKWREANPSLCKKPDIDPGEPC